MIRTLIVDDEPLARRAVQSLLDKAGDFEIVGEAVDGFSATAAIEALRPDLVFLDVQMPEMSGFEVIDAIGPDSMPLTVFVTAFDAHAVKAFEVQALDYVLKPFDDLRFARVLERVRRHRSGNGGRLRSMLDELRGERLVSRTNGTIQLVPLDDIDWIGSAGDYSEVHVGGRGYLVDESLASLAARLPRPEFARIHRSAIVRLSRIEHIRPVSHGDGFVRLVGGDELRFSRRYRKPLEELLARPG
jgi:two-component system LytT family response regulator